MASLKVIFFENMFYNEIHKFKKKNPIKESYQMGTSINRVPGRHVRGHSSPIPLEITRYIIMIIQQISVN